MKLSCVFVHCYIGLITGSKKVDSDLIACLGPALHCLLCWTDKSSLFCRAVLEEGLIFDCVDTLNQLSRATPSKVCMSDYSISGLLIENALNPWLLGGIYLNPVLFTAGR